MPWIAKPQGYWGEKAEYGALTFLYQNGRHVVIVLDGERRFELFDVRMSQFFPSIGTKVSISIGQTPVEGALLSLDWLWTVDIKEVYRREREAPAG